MKIKSHLTLMVASEFTAFFVGAAISFAWFQASDGDSAGLHLIQLMVPFFALNTLVNVIFRYVLPASCPADGCGKKCFPTGSKPITYKCRVCDFEHATQVSNGSGGHHGHDHGMNHYDGE